MVDLHTRHYAVMALGLMGGLLMLAPNFLTADEINQAHAYQAQTVGLITAAISLFGGQDVVKGWIVDLRANPKQGAAEILATLERILNAKLAGPSQSQPSSSQPTTPGKSSGS